MRLNCEDRYYGLRNSIFLVALPAVILTFNCNSTAQADPSNPAQNSKDSASLFGSDGYRRPLRQRGKAVEVVVQAKEGEKDSGEPGPQEEPPRFPPRSDMPLPPDASKGGFPKGPPGGRPWARFGPGPLGPGPLNLTPLNLTPEQKQKIQEIRKRTSTKARDLRKTLKEKRIEMRDAMFDPNVSETTLREEHRAVNKLHQKAEDAMFEDFLSIRALLTPEQKKHLPEVKPPFREPPGPGMMPHPPIKPALDAANKTLD